MLHNVGLGSALYYNRKTRSIANDRGRDHVDMGISCVEGLSRREDIYRSQHGRLTSLGTIEQLRTLSH